MLINKAVTININSIKKYHQNMYVLSRLVRHQAGRVDWHAVSTAKRRRDGRRALLGGTQVGRHADGIREQPRMARVRTSSGLVGVPLGGRAVGGDRETLEQCIAVSAASKVTTNLLRRRRRCRKRRLRLRRCRKRRVRLR